MNTKLPAYETEFHEALERTDLWGLCAPYFRATDSCFVEGNIQKIGTLLQKTLGRFSAEHVSQQCFAVTFFMKEQLESMLENTLTYTLGYVELNQKNVFYTPYEKLKELLINPVTSGPVNLHAWLTTPAYEIIDLTFSTTYGVVNNDPSCIGGMMAQHHSAFTQDLKHHPQIIGEDFLYEIGAIKELKL